MIFPCSDAKENNSITLCEGFTNKKNYIEKTFVMWYD